MIQINVVSRISEDKNSFFDLIYLVHKLQSQSVKDVHILFIGDIISPTLHRALLQLIDLFNLSGYIKFTQKSIRFTDLSEEIKAGYFVNFTVGNFMGFSGIESIKMNFKSIFYNPVKVLSVQTFTSASQCANLEDLVSLIMLILEDTAKADKLIIEDNLRMKADFLLTPFDKEFLNSVLKPPINDCAPN